MSRIDEQIKQLKEREKQLELEKKKIEFLKLIYSSSEEYDDPKFTEIKNGVLLKLSEFVDKMVESIEESDALIIELRGKLNGKNDSNSPQQSSKSDLNDKQPKKINEVKKPVELSPQEKMSFALDNRHYSNKDVSVENDKNLELTGKVVGLDAPNLLIKLTSGHIIKVPPEKVVIS